MRDAADRWHGPEYERLSDPQLRWGLRVLDRLALAGDETVLDAGCGTGRLTERLLERLPHGRVIAVDRSASMLRVARTKLGERFPGRIELIEADLQTFVSPVEVDVVFSTATFHWVLDHELLFRNLHASLRPGGRMIAQCGGGPNIARLRAQAARLMAQPAFAPRFEGFVEPCVFHDPASTARRVEDAGFVDVVTWLEEEPTPFDGPREYRDFIERIVLHRHLGRLCDTERAAFLDALVDEAERAQPPFTLDYWRLNLDARKPTREPAS